MRNILSILIFMAVSTPAIGQTFNKKKNIVDSTTGVEFSLTQANAFTVNYNRLANSSITFGLSSAINQMCATLANSLRKGLSFEVISTNTISSSGLIGGNLTSCTLYASAATGAP